MDFEQGDLFKSNDPFFGQSRKQIHWVCIQQKTKEKERIHQKPFACNGIFLLHLEDKLADILCIFGFRAFNRPIVLLPVSQRL